MSRLMHVATYSTHGMLAGELRTLRNIQGPQQWRVVIKIKTGKQIDEHVISSTDKVDLIAMHSQVISSINELLPGGGTITAANMDFYCRSKRK